MKILILLSLAAFVACDKSLPSGSRKFTCTSAGVFPDPTDSTIYHYCFSEYPIPETVACDPGKVFDIENLDCVPGTPSTTPGFDCESAEPNSMVVFKNDPAYYAMCSEINGVKETIVFKCPDVTTLAFDVETNECLFVCREAGNFIDRENCNGYISCVQSGTALVSSKKSCPAGQGFHRRFKKCEYQRYACVSEVRVDTTTTSPTTNTTPDYGVPPAGGWWG